MPTFTRIPSISKLRRLPRLGKIRLGVKVQTTSGKTYPKETPYFIVPPEVAAVYGEQPLALDVLFPINDLDLVMPVAYKWYGAAKHLRCVGNGQHAYRLNEATKQWDLRTCLCDKLDTRECSRRAHLLVILPKVNPGGVYQIDTGNLTSIIAIESTLQFLNTHMGRFAMIPMVLERVPHSTRRLSGETSTHYPLTVRAQIDPASLDRLRQETPKILEQAKSWRLAEPEDINPVYDPGAVVVTSTEPAPEITSSQSDDGEPTPELADLETEIVEEGGKRNVEDCDRANQRAVEATPQTNQPKPITERQKAYISKLVNGSLPEHLLRERLTLLSREEASALIEALKRGHDASAWLSAPRNTHPSSPGSAAVPQGEGSA